MKTYRLAIALPLLSSFACGSQTPTGTGETTDSTLTTLSTTATTAEGTSDGSGNQSTTVPSDTSSTPEETGDSGSGDGPKWDVGGAVDPGDCEKSPAGIYCDQDGVMTECNGNGEVVQQKNCIPDICVEGTGCVECLDGQYHCSGPRVMTCNADADPPHWVEIDVCDPTIGEGCDQGLGACEILVDVGTNIPTGEYFQYANFPVGASYMGGFDADSYDDRVFVTDFGGSRVDIYQIALLDSDGDGMLEPNQHPDNPDDMGPIEERTITFIESISPVFVYDTGLIASEIYALDDRMYVGGPQITEYVFGVPGSTVVTTAPNWTYFSQGIFSVIGYDDMNEVWYAANEADRRVFQHDAETDTWGIAFNFPDLAGSHMDGVEVVTDPNTGTPYVYVSDMTSDFIGQYRLDDEMGWVQENLFQYSGTAGESVEGMGFGYLNHFWVTGYQALYEIGGGDLVTYTEPEPVG